MAANAELRKTWRANWLTCLQGFADEVLQRRTWPGGETPYLSYDEDMCIYFDDMLNGDTYDWALAEGLVTEQEVAAVAKFHHLLLQYTPPSGNGLDSERILSDPAWIEVVMTAKKSIRELAAQLKDPEEREILTKG
jgi:hypothetical protein